MVNTREVVLEMLIEIFEKEKYSHLVTKAVLDKYSYLENSILTDSQRKKVIDGIVF